MDNADPILRTVVETSHKNQTEKRLAELNVLQKQLSQSTVSLAAYFVEDPAQFKVEECFKTINSFVKQIQHVIKVRTSE